MAARRSDTVGPVVKLFVVRHADAGHRDGIARPDDLRQLSERGLREARGLRDQFAEAGVERLLSSPVLRCRQTLQPLADRLGIAVETDERLAEGQGASGPLALVKELSHTSAVLCSHGDVIPELLDALAAGGTRLRDELRWQKASAWVFTRDGDELAEGRYLPPPR